MSLLQKIVIPIIMISIVILIVFSIFQFVDTDDREEQNHVIIKFVVCFMTLIVVGIFACKYSLVAIMLLLFIGWLVF